MFLKSSEAYRSLFNDIYGIKMLCSSIVGDQDKLTPSVIGLFTGPHQTSFRDSSSSTMRLSDGDRPVFSPEYAERAPLAVIAEPVSYTRASSYSAATEGFAT